jgi:hypothetical protein
VIVTLAIRSLATRPLRTALLACGFGFGIAVMAALLGVGEVILAQSRSPALQGGGDVVIYGRFGMVDSARFLLANVLGAPDVKPGVVAASPSRRGSLFLLSGTRAIPVVVKGGVPSLEHAVGDPEIAGISAWRDRPVDRPWLSPPPGDLLRAMDRFHPVPDLPEFAASWAEWLYFNGRTEDGRGRFYLTFLVGPRSNAPGKRSAGVRLQIDRDGRMQRFAQAAEVDEARVLAETPNLEIGGSRVRLDGLQYLIDLALPGASGRLVLEPGGHSLPPASIRGARGWISGYVAPVLAGRLNGSIDIGGAKENRVVFENAPGYHDHNWGFWEGVRWQWGQVATAELSIIYGRVFPPESVADVDRIPGFLGVLGPNGPLAFSTAVSIEDRAMAAGPRQIVVRARGSRVDLVLTFTAERTERTRLGVTGESVAALDFLQLSGDYHVKGRVADREVEFRSRGAAETFQPATGSGNR